MDDLNRHNHHHNKLVLVKVEIVEISARKIIGKPQIQPSERYELYIKSKVFILRRYRPVRAN